MYTVVFIIKCETNEARIKTLIGSYTSDAIQTMIALRSVGPCPYQFLSAVCRVALIFVTFVTGTPSWYIIFTIGGAVFCYRSDCWVSRVQPYNVILSDCVQSRFFCHSIYEALAWRVLAILSTSVAFLMNCHRSCRLRTSTGCQMAYFREHRSCNYKSLLWYNFS